MITSKNFRTQDCFHPWVYLYISCILLPKLLQYRLQFVCLDDLNLVHIRQHFLPCFLSYEALHLLNCLGLCKAVTALHLFYSCQVWLSRLSIFSCKLLLLRPIFTLEDLWSLHWNVTMLYVFCVSIFFCFFVVYQLSYPPIKHQEC